MARHFLDDIADELTAVIGSGMDTLLSELLPDPDETLMRKFSSKYGNISVDELQAVIGVSGHLEGEPEACRVCKIMARKTIELSED